MIVLYLLFSLLVPVVIITTIVIVIVKLTRKDQPMVINANVLLNVYFYAIIFITQIVAAVGAMMFINALFALMLGNPFSYQPQAKYLCDTKTNIETYADGTCIERDAVKRDLVNGGTLAGSMLVLLGLHVAGLYLNGRKQKTPTIRKLFFFTSLAVFSVVSVIAIPVAIYQVVNYLVFPQTDLDSYSRIVPGPVLATVIVFVPVWLGYLAKMVFFKEHAPEEALRT